MSSSSALAEADLDTLSILRSAAAQVDKVQVTIYRQLERLVKTSNAITASYHTLVQGHENCEGMIKKLAVQGPLNGLIANIQAHKALIEREMLKTEDLQSMIWTEIQKGQMAGKWKASKIC